ncbi:MAG: trypsin-like peptidase domain-containing protein [Patescibacteria group bacterium]|nr:trypsin-like peptidase domain-containing protein [Patescibacteria group bacterium]MDE1988101.1 trypsin-like peptidase domain-containing protein [Patescibacteria group bacterium]MDE2218206.1 trypsin-like peptidase domain-containing protein [Patescibacteria group bacterium]
MENLTKHQLILVALLISFVTSIATGIVTVSLMDQAPKGVTQTVNRIVEKTVERVISEPNKGSNIIKETIVVKEDDRTIEAIEKNAKSMVRIYKTDSSNAETSLKSFVGLGIIISKDGDIATDAAIIASAASYSVVSNDGKEYSVKITPTSAQEKNIIAFLRIIPKEKEVLSLTPAILADSDALKLGQTVISLGGKLRNSVAIGVITSFIESNNSNLENMTTPEILGMSGKNESTTTVATGANTENLAAAANESVKENSPLTKENKGISAAAEKSMILIETNIIPNDNTTGNPFINLSSEVVGIRVKASSNAQTISFAPINEVKNIFSAASASPTMSSSSKQGVN